MTRRIKYDCPRFLSQIKIIVYYGAQACLIKVLLGDIREIHSASRESRLSRVGQDHGACLEKIFLCRQAELMCRLIFRPRCGAAHSPVIWGFGGGAPEKFSI